jgi:hypothetical protein
MVAVDREEKNMDLAILPLAMTMMVGPGIMADVVLITAPKPVKVSAAFVLGVAIATTMAVLQNADPRRAFTPGLLLIWVMPSDFIIMPTVGVNLAHNGAGLFAALPFIGATVLVAAIPVQLYLLFRRRAQRPIPRVRDWMNANSWLVNIIACVAFIVLILFG